MLLAVRRYIIPKKITVLIQTHTHSKYHQLKSNFPKNAHSRDANKLDSDCHRRKKCGKDCFTSVTSRFFIDLMTGAFCTNVGICLQAQKALQNATAGWISCDRR